MGAQTPCDPREAPPSRGRRAVVAWRVHPRIRMVDEPEVLLIILDAGGGHRAAANALVAAAALGPRAWRLRVVNLQEVLSPFDVAPRLTGLSMEDAYNAIVRRQS